MSRKMIITSPKKFITLTFGLSCLFPLWAWATADYNARGIAFKNPANLNKIKQKEIKLGFPMININMQSSGKGFQPSTRSSQPQGEDTSSVSDVNPYFRLARRITPKWVTAFEIVQPWYFSQRFPNDSFTRYIPPHVKTRSYEVGFKTSYQITKSLAVGAGVAYTRISTGIVGGIFPAPNSDIPFTFSGEDWYWHYNFGFNWRPTQTTIIAGSWFSPQKFDLRGHTEMNGKKASGKVRAEEPAIAKINLTQFITRNWLVNVGTTWQGWGTKNSVRIPLVSSVAGIDHIRLKPRFHDTFTTHISTAYQIKPDIRLLAAYIDDRSPYPDSAFSLGLPLPNVTVYQVGTILTLPKGFKLKGTIAHADARHTIHSLDETINGEKGTVHGSANLANIELTYTFNHLKELWQ